METMRCRVKAIVMDIDNTFCEKRGILEYSELEPKKEIVQQMKDFQKKGYKAILQTVSR